METVFEMKIMTSNRFFYIAREIEAKGIQDDEVSLRRARELVHEYGENEQPGSPEVKNITVTCDGSWSKRGFVAKFCVVSVIHFDTGLVVDYQNTVAAPMTILAMSCAQKELIPSASSTKFELMESLLEAMTNIFTNPIHQDLKGDLYDIMKKYSTDGKSTGSHDQHIHQPIHQDLKGDLYDIMKKYSTDEHLSRCTGRTQNANESLNSVLWSKCSKTVFYQKERVHYQIAKAITEFNFGFARSGGLVASGKLGKKIRTGLDVKKHKSFESRQEKKENRRSKKRKVMEEAKKVTKEGTTL
ncbi:hypothetical protein Pmani_032578 [Petrolisthes manimaculis]|uniref:Uncharacterized protein n=1 Tax=Petrolisthes manimaculis TaxID=1843537 RepID=A0AAE1NTC4_9EUCA|nr:hypothetical protein Pmani_032578 [Petrolisthes manimaculis]